MGYQCSETHLNQEGEGEKVSRRLFWMQLEKATVVAFLLDLQSAGIPANWRPFFSPCASPFCLPAPITHQRKKESL